MQLEVILVVGGSGDLGHRIVSRLREREQEVRCLVRPDTDAVPLRDLGADVVRAHLTDRKSLRAACAVRQIATATAIARVLAGGVRHCCTNERQFDLPHDPGKCRLGRSDRYPVKDSLEIAQL